jgi:hypothetical protein
MTTFLYWLVYNFDLGPLGPTVLDLAVKSWLRRARERVAQPAIRQRIFGLVTTFHLEPSFGADERM